MSGGWAGRAARRPIDLNVDANVAVGGEAADEAADELGGGVDRDSLSLTRAAPRYTLATRWIAAVAAAAALVMPTVARADLYTFTDEEGVIHFTNLPDDDARTHPVRMEESANTFAWRDELGVLRKVHRVDVRTYDALIVEAARYYSLPPALVKAVIAVESSFEPTAVSPAGAVGLMQLVPRTAAEVFVGDLLEPRANVYGGARYLRILANRFSGDLRLTVAAYNAGPVAVERAQDVPPFAETRRYVQRVIALYRHYLSNWQPESP